VAADGGGINSLVKRAMHGTRMMTWQEIRQVSSRLYQLRQYRYVRSTARWRSLSLSDSQDLVQCYQLCCPTAQAGSVAANIFCFLPYLFSSWCAAAAAAAALLVQFYGREVVNLRNEGRWVFLNTLFSVSEAVMYMQVGG
jgi:hypothetical protein